MKSGSKKLDMYNLVKKLSLLFFPYLVLASIFGGYFLLTRQAPFYFSIGIMLCFLFLYFFLGVAIVGNLWALISTFLLAFSMLVLSAAFSNVEFLIPPLALIIAIEFFLFYIRKPDNIKLIFSGILMGLSMSVLKEAWVILPLAIFLIVILSLAKLGREWRDIDLTMRHHKIRIAMKQNLKNILLLIFVSFATIYVIFMIYSFQYTTDYSEPMLANWLLNNPAFRPFGEYLLLFENENLGFENLGKMNWIDEFIEKESTSLVAILFFGFVFYVVRLAQFFIKCLFNKMVLVNYLGLYEREFFYNLFIVVFGLINIFSFHSNIIRIILLPYLILISLSLIKEWFTVFDQNLARNILVKVFIFKNNLVSLSLKTVAIFVILIWHLIIVVRIAPFFPIFDIRSLHFF